jgi:carbonyl reductase 1
VNHVHPGYVDTDMTSHKGPLTIDRGAQSALFAALLPAGTEVSSACDATLGHQVRGAYIWHDCQIVDWVNGPTPPMT